LNTSVKYFGVWLCCAHLLVACQTTPTIDRPLATPQLIVERDAKLSQLKPWRASGSLVVDSEEQGAVSASFAWDVSSGGYDIQLFGPLGIKSVRLIQDSASARLLSKGDEIQGASGEALVRDALGLSLPLDDMQDWAVGLPGRAVAPARDKFGRLSEISVGNAAGEAWQVVFERYAMQDGLDLPRRIRVSGDGLEIRMSVKKWSKPKVASQGRLLIPEIGQSNNGL